jgi:hypothetical protein
MRDMARAHLLTIRSRLADLKAPETNVAALAEWCGTADGRSQHDCVVFRRSALAQAPTTPETCPLGAAHGLVRWWLG